MTLLEVKHPNVFAEFPKGNFAVKKTGRAFSAIVTVQAYEQNNTTWKGNGGAVGLTKNPAALWHWVVACPEMARVIGEIEVSIEKRKKTDPQHHEQTDVTCTDGICLRCQIANKCHRQDGESI